MCWSSSWCVRWVILKQSNDEWLWLELPLFGGEEENLWEWAALAPVVSLSTSRFKFCWKELAVGQVERDSTQKEWLRGQKDLRGDHQKHRWVVTSQLEKQSCSGWVTSNWRSSAEEIYGVCKNTSETIYYSKGPDCNSINLVQLSHFLFNPLSLPW